MSDRASILAEIVELSSVAVREDDEFTVYELLQVYAEKGQVLTDEGVRYRLGELVKAGILTTRLAHVPERRRTCRVWRKVKQV